MVAETADDNTPLRVVRTETSFVFTGEIDAHTSALVSDVLLPLPAAGDVVVELSGVSFVDSSGLRLLLDVHRVLERDGRRLIVLAPSRPVRRLIEIAGLVSHLHVEPPLDPPS